MRSDTFVALLSLTTLIATCGAFVAPSGSAIKGLRFLTARLHDSLVFEFEKEDEEDENKSSNNVGQSTNPNNGPPDQEIVLVFSVPSNSFVPAGTTPNTPSISTMIAKWNNELKNSRPPPLTSVRRARAEKEITLLPQLVHSNEAATALSTLWIHERGPAAAQALQIAQGLAQGGASRQAEQILSLMIQEEGIHFLAPISQLAQLYTMQGRFKEAKQLHELVLRQKPWYLSSLVGIHDVCRKADVLFYKDLVKWDSEVIPTLKNPELREAWVQRMVTKAQTMLNQQESHLQGYFDEFYNTHGSDASVILVAEDDNAWQ